MNWFSVEKIVIIDIFNDEEGGDDVDDEDSVSFKRDVDEYEDDIDYVEDEFMFIFILFGNLYRFVGVY